MCVFSPSTDVVRAYRGTIKEKEALEATLNALSRDGGCEGEREMVGGVESEEEEGEGEGEGVSEVRETEEEESDADTSMATERKVLLLEIGVLYLEYNRRNSSIRVLVIRRLLRRYGNSWQR